MTLHQRFRLDDVVECLAVCQGKDGLLYSRLDDIQETFPGAIRFKLGKVTINFLTDENGNRCVTKERRTSTTNTLHESIADELTIILVRYIGTSPKGLPTIRSTSSTSFVLLLCLFSMSMPPSAPLLVPLQGPNLFPLRVICSQPTM